MERMRRILSIQPPQLLVKINLARVSALGYNVIRLAYSTLYKEASTYDRCK